MSDSNNPAKNKPDSNRNLYVAPKTSSPTVNPLQNRGSETWLEKGKGGCFGGGGGGKGGNAGDFSQSVNNPLRGGYTPCMAYVSRCVSTF